MTEKIVYKSLVTENLSAQIAENVREAIVSGRLQVNDRLPTEEELAVRFNVSRPTIREALKRLAAQNLIRSRRGPSGGAFVNHPSWQDVAQALSVSTMLLTSMGEFNLNEIADARQELGIVCSRMAARLRDQQDLAAMDEELATQQGADLSDVDFCGSDVRFHHAVVQATKNRVLRLVMVGVTEALQPIANLVSFRFSERKKIIAQHERLYKAIEQRDPDKAAAVIVDQMAYLRDIYGRAETLLRRRKAAAG
jgi:DNA-binding FadR family transcriptional regulator